MDGTLNFDNLQLRQPTTNSAQRIWKIIQQEELRQSINSLCNNKATGVDEIPTSGVTRTEFMVFNLRGELETLDNNKLKQMTSSTSAHRLHQLRETSPREEKHGQPFEIRKSYKEFRSSVKEI